MKKTLSPLSTILFVLAAMAFSPLGVADTPLGPDKWGVCGNPAEQTTEYFCTETHDHGLCAGGFTQQVVDGCVKRLHSPRACTLRRIKAQMHTVGLNAICKRFPPPGISFEVCEITVGKFLSDCH